MPESSETEPQFGVLREVPIRDVWPNEARDFTPWLNANLERLSEAVGIPMEADGTEVAVGNFSADIVARNPESQNGSLVLIENQLERSDHSHLGQLLTYLAGVQAQTVIWIARAFDESHLSAIRWLNDHTEEPFAFLAVRVQVVRIEESPLVPQFEVLERPSGWDRTVRATLESQTSELGQFRLAFWTLYANRHPNDGVAAGYKAASCWVWINSAELYLTMSLSKDAVSVEVRGERTEDSEAVRARIQQWEQPLLNELRVEIGEGTSWGTYAKSHFAKDATDRDNWPAMADWLHGKIAEYRRVFESRPAPEASE